MSITPALSVRSTAGILSGRSSLRARLSQLCCLMPMLRDMYLASAIEVATEYCFLLRQQIVLRANQNRYREYNCLSSMLFLYHELQNPSSVAGIAEG